MTSRRILSAAIAATLALGTYQAYAYDENFKGYEVHNVSVKADAAKRMSMVIPLLSNLITVLVVM